MIKRFNIAGIAMCLFVMLAAVQGRAGSITYHLRMDGNVPEQAVLFVGDSITEALCVAAVTERGVNYGIGGDTTSGVFTRINQYESRKRVRAIVIAIGVNDIARGVKDPQIFQNYKLILQSMPRTTPVVFSAILPVDSRLVSYEPLRNDRIAAVNRKAQKICAEFSNCHFMDSGPKMLDADGMLAAAYHEGDGIHLGTEGYKVWIADLSEALNLLSENKE
jgi:lysophospholipase L1-like esterase